MQVDFFYKKKNEVINIFKNLKFRRKYLYKKKKL